MNAKHFSLAFLLVASLVTACSGGADVTLTPAEDRRNSSAVACDITSGEDLCSRSYDVAQERRVDFVAFLQDAALVAGLVDELSTRLLDACDSMAAELGVVAPTPAGSSAREKQLAVCSAVGKEVATAGLSLVEVGPRSCGLLFAPPCAASPHFPLPVLERCDPPTIALGPSTGAPIAPARSQAIGASVIRHGGEIMWATRQSESVQTLFVTITTRADFLRTLSGAESICTLPAAQVLKEAADSFQGSSEARAALLLAFAPNQ